MIAVGKYVIISPEKYTEAKPDQFVSVSSTPVVTNIGIVVSAGPNTSSVKTGDRVAYKVHYAEELEGNMVTEESNIYAIL